MILNYSKLAFDSAGRPEYPVLMLQTMGGEAIGTIPAVSNLKLHIKFAEPSEIEFDVSSVSDGVLNWIYDEISGYKLLYTECYGIYVLMNPEESSNGMERQKHVKGFSLEYTLNTKKFFLEGGDGAGTFKFFNATNAYDPNTIIGRVLEVARGWRVGFISGSVAQRYRSFDQYDNYLLPFLYGDAATKYHCVFVFEPYQKTINVFDADEPLSMLPIYMDFDNLLNEIEVSENSDELITALRPYGADELSIRSVNPTGTNWIYDLSYFIANGDIPADLAEKWNGWQHSILRSQSYFSGLDALQASAYAQITADQASLTDLNGELESLKAQRSVLIQAQALETTAEGREEQQVKLDELNRKIDSKQAEIDSKQDEIVALSQLVDDANPNSYTAKKQAIRDELAIERYFTDEEYQFLSQYMIEQDLTEESFVASSVDTTAAGTSYVLDNQDLAITGSIIEKIQPEDVDRTIYVMRGGQFVLSGVYNVAGDVIRGTLDTAANGDFVASFYAGSIQAGEHSASSGVITVTGMLNGLASDIHSVTEDGITTMVGSEITFDIDSGTLFLSANVSDYQKYSVEMELFDFAVKALSDAALPVYEFSVDSANFLFSSKFAPFRDELELGKGVYLRLSDNEVITPYIIEFELYFEDESSFSILFSNRFQRKDTVNTLRAMIEKSYSYGRSFNASKYLYGDAVSKTAAVSKFISGSFDSAVNTIIAAKDQSVIIDGSGIDITSSDMSDPYLQKFGLHLMNGMIAFTQDGWQHAEIAIGVFKTENGYHSGVNAKVVAGNLIVGNNLIIENESDQGVMQFKVDASGAWLNNSTFLLQKDNGGKILIDPRYGIVGGNGALYTMDGTTVRPSFTGADGEIETDAEGMPTNSNFYLDLRDGAAYFRGKLLARSGQIGGFTIENDYLHTGSGGNYVAMNGSGTNENSLYAFWAGAAAPASAPFWVKKNGDMKAHNGDFSGTIRAARVINLSAGDESEDDGWIVGCGIAVPDREHPAFQVDKNGNVTLKGHITWDSDNTPVQYQFSADGVFGWHDVMNEGDLFRRDSLDGGATWGPAYQFKGTDASVTYENVNAALGQFFSQNAILGTYIDRKYIQSPVVQGGVVQGIQLLGAEIYAGIGAENMAKMDSNGFYLLRKHGDQWGPKAALVTAEGSGSGQSGSTERFSQVTLMLGMGDGDLDNLSGRMFMTKSWSSSIGQAGVLAYGTGNGTVNCIGFVGSSGQQTYPNGLIKFYRIPETSGDGSIIVETQPVPVEIQGTLKVSDEVTFNNVLRTSGTLFANAGVVTPAVRLKTDPGTATLIFTDDNGNNISWVGIDSGGDMQINPNADNNSNRRKLTINGIMKGARILAEYGMATLLFVDSNNNVVAQIGIDSNGNMQIDPGNSSGRTLKVNGDLVVAGTINGQVIG